MFDCGGRRAQIRKIENGLQRELEAMKKWAGDSMIFGFYGGGGGVIGHVDNDSPSEGVSHNISVGSIYVK